MTSEKTAKRRVIMNKGPIRRYRNQISAQKPTDQAFLGNQTFKQGVIPLSAIDREMIL